MTLLSLGGRSQKMWAAENKRDKDTPRIRVGVYKFLPRESENGGEERGKVEKSPSEWNSSFHRSTYKLTPYTSQQYQKTNLIPLISKIRLNHSQSEQTLNLP